jgi:NADH dehydrogenase FAD-containing subunit
LHAAPPMLPAKELRESKLVDATGFVDVQKETLQHKKYENVFAIGDCANLPTSKTAAAISVQSDILQKNILAVMNGSKDTFLKVSLNLIIRITRN